MNWQRLMAKAFGFTAYGLMLGFAIGSWIIAGQFIAPVPSKVTLLMQLPFVPENVTFPATDGVSLSGWFIPQENSTKAVVLLHGLAANRTVMLKHAIWLRSLGYNTLLYDARGCGESAPVERSFGYRETRDLLGAITWLRSRGITQIACLGMSQGAATILLASDQLPPEVRAVVAEASYATLQEAVDNHFRIDTGLPSCYWGALIVPFAEWKLGMNVDEVSPLREIPKLKAPLYLIGGTVDTTAPPAGIHQLYEAAVCEKTLWMIEGAGHADFFSYAPAEYKQRIGDFLKRHL